MTQSLLRNRRHSGQILIVAIIIMGVLLILGFTFAAILSRNINFAARSTKRTLASDLAEAGIRLAHNQLVISELGADWRPEPTPPMTDANGYTKDPDALFLRIGSGFPVHEATPTDGVVDMGGPDGLGSYTRITYAKGRVLVRVRYAPSDFNVFASPTGPLRQPGKARNYLMIEAIGRPGRVLANDPSTLLNEAVRVTNYAGAGEYYAEMAKLRRTDTLNVDERRILAFASIGIIESARFITNKYNVSRQAELGSITPPLGAGDSGPSRDDLGVIFDGDLVSIPTQWGGALVAINGTTLATGTGSLYSNASVLFHGRHNFLLNPNIGDMVAVANDIVGANDAAQLSITNTAIGNNVVLGKNTNPSYSSNRNNYTTFRGLLRDGVSGTDRDEYPRAIGYKAPPSIQTVDPAIGATRYTLITRQSGVLFQGRNIGQFGYGRGVYCDSSERANRTADDEQLIDEAVRSLPNDWLNPNNSGTTGWQGPYYRPLAAHLSLMPDGFVITRDSRSRNRHWRRPDQASTNSATMRYRLRTVNGVCYIINGVQHADIINLPAVQVADSQFVTRGQPFNGVVMFEGDVRVRGVIPTNKQITVVSMGSIYVEGSITKGVVDEAGNLLSSPSTSMCMLMARDYVVLNTTQFFAPAPGEDPVQRQADNLPNTPVPVELSTDEMPQMTLVAQMLLDPATPLTAGGNPFNPQTWRPYATQYTEFGSNAPIDTRMLLTHSADNGGPAFINLNIAAFTFSDLTPPPNLFNSYFFQRDLNFGAAGSIPFNLCNDQNIFPGTGNIPMYGLGNAAINAYPKFETLALPLVRPGNWTVAGRKLIPNAGNAEGSFQLALQDESAFRLGLTAAGPYAPKNYELARTAVTPHDIRIEAALYAEEGSFFVIPGPDFNYNAADTREEFNNDVLKFQGSGNPEDLARRERFEEFGAMPEVPFFGEPLDVRIQIVGAISENMPPPIGQQAAWQRKWGWIPRSVGATGRLIPRQHVPPGYDLTVDKYVPNLIISYDPALAMGSADGVNPIRTVIKKGVVYPLAPMPRLPVSPTLVYFGEVNP